MRDHVLAEPGHRRRDDQASTGHGHSQVYECAADTTGQRRTRGRGEEGGEQQRPAPAGEGGQPPRGGELEVARVEPHHRHPQIGRNRAGDPRREAVEGLEHQPLPERELEPEGRVATDEGAMAIAHRPREHPSECGGVGQRREARNEQRPHGLGIDGHITGEAANHAVGHNRPDLGIVERGGGPAAELAFVHQRRLRVPAHRRGREQQRSQDHESDTGPFGERHAHRPGQ